MEIRSTELADPLNLLPPVDFCCAYGSSLLSNKKDKTSMVDYIIGVADPEVWHSENFESNMNHYSRWMARLGPRKITWIADRIGVGVHFNPFVECGDKMIKYGVVRMHDLARDVLMWDKFYLSGRLQKPVHILVDKWDIRKVNVVNLKAAICAALLLLPSAFTEEDLYVKICSLSYMGDLRMLFAEDKNKVKKIVQGSFKTFQAMYKPLLKEYTDEGLLECRYHPHSAFEQGFLQSNEVHIFGYARTNISSEDLRERLHGWSRSTDLKIELLKPPAESILKHAETRINPVLRRFCIEAGSYIKVVISPPPQPYHLQYVLPHQPLGRQSC